MGAAVGWPSAGGGGLIVVSASGGDPGNCPRGGRNGNLGPSAKVYARAEVGGRPPVERARPAPHRAQGNPATTSLNSASVSACNVSVRTFPWAPTARSSEAATFTLGAWATRA